MEKTATFGGGCFWCIEAVFNLLNGVTKVVSGYAGGMTPNPNFEQIHYENTGHAEVIQVTFDTNVITYREILEIFFAVHDPTTLNRQNYDVGELYRSIILYHNDAQKHIAEDVIMHFAADLWGKPITTKVEALEKFWPAEDYHQDFYASNPNVGYCQVIINPKVQKFRQQFASKLKQP